MDINLTGHLWGMPLDLSGTAYQPLIYIILGGIAGALISGILKIIEDGLIRKWDREDNRNKLLGQFIGQNRLILQLYAFYFFSFISHEYLLFRSTIDGIHGINYDYILESIPREKWSEVAMEMANEAALKSIAYQGFLKEDKNLEEAKLRLARGIKDLFIIIGSLQAFYHSNTKIYEYIKSIETAMDDYNKLELAILHDFDMAKTDVLKRAGLIIGEASTRQISANIIRDQYYYKWAIESDKLRNKLKQDRHERDEKLQSNINKLIEYLCPPLQRASSSSENDTTQRD